MSKRQLPTDKGENTLLIINHVITQEYIHTISVSLKGCFLEQNHYQQMFINSIPVNSRSLISYVTKICQLYACIQRLALLQKSQNRSLLVAIGDRWVRRLF